MTDTPRASRPYRALLLAIAPMLETDAYLSMSEKEFVGAAMKASGGALAPALVAQEYHRLISEAGTGPGYASSIGGEMSWEADTTRRWVHY